MAMQMMFFCPYWGHQHVDIEPFAKQVKDAGYDGVEMGLPLDDPARDRTVAVLRDYDLALIAQHHETNLRDWQAHKEAYERCLRRLAAAQPLLINAHTGKDYFSFEQNAALIKLADSVAHETGVRILHDAYVQVLAGGETELIPSSMLD